MLLRFNPTKWDRTHGPLPSQLLPLYASSESQASLSEAARLITSRFGFDSFIYAMTTSESLNNGARFHCCSSAPRDWIAEYDQASYVEIDPRVTHSWTQLTPLMWDRTIGSGRSDVEVFLDRAALYGIGSGVCIPMRDEGHSRIAMFLNSSRRENLGELDGSTGLVLALHRSLP